MKRVLASLILLCAACFGQGYNSHQVTTFTSAGTATRIYQNSTSSYHQIFWATSGGPSSACSVAVDSSPDNVTWTAGGIISSQTCTTNGNSAVVGPVSATYIRVDVSTLTTTGTLTITYNGYASNPGGGGGAVSSVFARTGAVVAVTGDYTVGQVTGAAPLASPTFTGTPTAPTPSTSDNSTKLATTAYVQAQPAGGVTSFFGNTGNITTLVDPTIIVDAAGNELSFTSTGVSLSDLGGDICSVTQTSPGTISCTDSLGDSWSMSNGIVSFLDNDNDGFTANGATATATMTDGNGDAVNLSGGSLNAAMFEGTLVSYLTLGNGNFSISDGTAGDLVVGQAGNLTLQAAGSQCVLDATQLVCGVPITSPALLVATTSPIGGSLLTAGTCSSTTVSISGASSTSNTLATPVTYPGDAMFWKSYVSSADNVTVLVCASVAGTPISTVYNVRVFN